MRADDEASLATRPAKDHSLTPRLLAARWQAEAAKVSLAVGAELEAAGVLGDPALGLPSAEELTAALLDPATGLCSRSARFTEADVFEHLCALSAGRLQLGEFRAWRPASSHRTRWSDSRQRPKRAGAGRRMVDGSP